MLLNNGNFGSRKFANILARNFERRLFFELCQKAVNTVAICINQEKDNNLYAATDNGCIVMLDALSMLKTIIEKEKDPRP